MLLEERKWPRRSATLPGARTTKGVFVIDRSVNPAVRASDPFAHAGTRREDQDHPHGCIDGVVYIGDMTEDPETGEEVEVFEAVSCRRCS